MLKIVARQTVKKEEIDRYISLAGKLSSETHKEDAGCISYALFQDINNPQILAFIEEWEDQAALDKHLNSRHFKEIAPELEKLCEKPGDVTFYRAV